MERKLNISWEEPAEPNDYTLNYTVTITDISTGTELSRTVVLDVDQLTVLTEILGIKCLAMLFCCFAAQCCFELCFGFSFQ